MDQICTIVPFNYLIPKCDKDRDFIASSIVAFLKTDTQ